MIVGVSCRKDTSHLQLRAMGCVVSLAVSSAKGFPAVLFFISSPMLPSGLRFPVTGSSGRFVVLLLFAPFSISLLDSYLGRFGFKSVSVCVVVTGPGG